MAGSAAPTDLGTKPVGALLRQYAVPGIIAMTASSLYNMVDSIYIGHIPEVGSLSMSGLAVTFPLMNISTAFGTLLVGLLDGLRVGNGDRVVAGADLHGDVHLAVLIEHLEGVHGRRETAVGALVRYLKGWLLQPK